MLENGDYEQLQIVMQELRRRSYVAFLEHIATMDHETIEAQLLRTFWTRCVPELNAWEHWLVVDVLRFPASRVEAIAQDALLRRGPIDGYERGDWVVPVWVVGALRDALDEHGDLPRL